ncbi:shikimate dehydrogenase [Intestinimonas massiliensis (ex Afouda et al. 2020)]|uniref:shikimate dehydrogenase n=1 Tax=Intestinimonas massiliensis (ex Afouda et al. 2020) TaxID=1673721 RepID=UPI0010324B0F|nr:shikimate dehydrogenase [Intestinimonas massiliensis (ex Afouda et al. 2020)]
MRRPSVPLPRIGMRVIKTAVAVMVSYALFLPFGLTYREELGGVLGQMGPLYACIACIICTQSTLGQTFRQGISRLIGVIVGGALGTATLLLGPALENLWIKTLVLGAVCVAGVWICLLIKRPTACGMACILPCVILITGVTGVTRYYYAAARMIETVVGLLVALAVNAALPDHRPESKRGESDMKVEVDNSTKKLCVIGDPVLHSKSPLIQNTMIRELGLDYVYLCQPVPRGKCKQWLDCAKFAGYAGFNATMPHKEELVPLMDELDADAALIGAVNTVCIRDGKAYGYNTDGEGFLRSLADEGINPAGKQILVLGAGGAAKAVCLKLAQAGAAVTVCNRTLEKAEAICAHDPAHLRPAGFDAAVLYKEAQSCDLLVNCTSLGMAGTKGQFEDFSFLDGLRPGVPVVDLIYAPAQTELLRQAKQRGHKTVNGFGLLVNQAVLALEYFTGAQIDAARMKKVLSGVL